MKTVNCSELIEKFSPTLNQQTFPYYDVVEGKERRRKFHLASYFRELFYDNDLDDEAFSSWYNESEEVMEDGSLYCWEKYEPLLKPLNDFLRENKITVVMNDCFKENIDGIIGEHWPHSTPNN